MSTSNTTILEQHKESNNLIASDLLESDPYLYQYELQQPIINQFIHVYICFTLWAFRKSVSSKSTSIPETPIQSNTYIASDLPESDAHLYQYDLEQPNLYQLINQIIVNFIVFQEIRIDFKNHDHRTTKRKQHIHRLRLTRIRRPPIPVWTRTTGSQSQS